MTLTPVPAQDDGQGPLHTPYDSSPYSLYWWTEQVMTNIPGEAVGWLVAQGWQITTVTYDETTNPPTPYYALGRRTLQNWMVLQSLLNSYTTASNTAKEFNDYRYNSVIESWAEMLTTSQSYMETQATEQNAQVTLYLGNLATYMDEVDALIDANQAQIVADAATAATALTAMDAKLSDLETNADANAATIEGLLAEQANYLSTFLADFSGKLAELDTNYTAHLATMVTLLADATTDLEAFATSQSPGLADIEAGYETLATDLPPLLTSIDEHLSTLADEINAILSQLDTDYSAVDTEVNEWLTTSINALSSYASDYETTLNLITTDYTAIASELDAARTSSADKLSSHDTAYTSDINLLPQDYDSHSVTAQQFLVDLGMEELARINEHFAATLSAQIQELVDRGLYNSVLIADITARNDRDRDEELQKLYDRLAREKLENQHHLYDQQAAMRGRVMEGRDRLHGVHQQVHGQHVGEITSRFGMQQSARDRTLAGKDRLHGVKQEIYRFQAAQITGLYQLLQAARDRVMNGKSAIYSLRDSNTRLNIEVKSQLHATGQAVEKLLIDEAARLHQLRQAVTQWETGQRDRLLEQIQQIETQHLAGIERQHAAQQDISRVSMSARDNLLAQLQDAVKGIIAGKERYGALTMQNASVLAEHKHRAIVEKMNESVARLEGQRGMHAENMKLMAYQLSTRNEILIGLYGFVERRDDVGPEWQELAKVVAGLGDSGGGWLTP